MLPSQAHDPALLSHARQPSDCTFVVDYLYLLNFEGGGVHRFDPAEPASADHWISQCFRSDGMLLARKTHAEFLMHSAGAVPRFASPSLLTRGRVLFFGEEYL